MNILEILMNDTHGDECLIRVDTACLEVMKEELRKDDLLLKEDIVNYNLLYHSCHPMSKMRFEYNKQLDLIIIILNYYL